MTTEADYKLLDCGNMEKLEQVGPYRLRRPSPQAIWLPKLSADEWERADGTYVRDSSGSGKWAWQRKVSREFDVLFNSLAFHIKLTNFGHMGLFPEQADNWTLAARQDPPAHVEHPARQYPCAQSLCLHRRQHTGRQPDRRACCPCRRGQGRGRLGAQECPTLTPGPAAHSLACR